MAQLPTVTWKYWQHRASCYNLLQPSVFFSTKRSGSWVKRLHVGHWVSSPASSPSLNISYLRFFAYILRHFEKNCLSLTHMMYRLIKNYFHIRFHLSLNANSKNTLRNDWLSHLGEPPGSWSDACCCWGSRPREDTIAYPRWKLHRCFLTLKWVAGVCLRDENR